jgi:hypothetical protein
MKLMFTCLLSLFSLFSFSQDWATIGATWHYTELEAFYPTIDFFKIEASGTQMVKGKLCTVMSFNDSPMCNPIAGGTFTYEENDTVYWYNSDLDSLMYLYDFTAGVGDSWNMLFLDPNNLPDVDTLNVTVDSVDTININGFNLKRLHVRYDFIGEIYSWWYFGVIIEDIGDTYYMFNFPHPDGMFCDGNYPDYLRCYEDTVIGFQGFMGYDSLGCEYIYTSLDEIEPESEINVYPNPFSSTTTVEFDFDEEIESIVITNLIGKIIKQTPVNSKQGRVVVDLSQVPTGIYTLSLRGVRYFNQLKIIRI